MGYMKTNEVPREVLARVRLVCTELPEVDEEQAWEGTRWTIRGKNFAHVLVIAAENRKPTRGPRAHQAPPAC